MEKTTCYMCSNQSVSKEHVPPKCLFPEAKDSNGLDLKKRLITVPSCDIHNSAKSHDDEFLMISLAGIINNNIVGQNHFYTKVDRALRRKEKDFLNKHILKNLKYQSIKTIDNKFTIAAIGHPNFDRLVNCFESISYGLFFHELQRKFEGEIRMVMGFIDYKDATMQTLKKLVRKRFEIEKELLEDIKGDNPQVFHYQFCKPDENGLIALKLVFYETSEIFISFKSNDSTVPFSLVFKFIESGINTTVNVGDEKFKFNQ